MSGLIWTPTMVDALRELHARVPEFSFREMAQRMQALGYPVSRNALIGKARRLGLPVRDLSAHVAVSTARIVAYNKTKAEGPRMPYVRLVKGKAPSIVPSEQQTRIGRRTGLHIDLEHDQCRWPVGPGPDQHSIYLFCTKDVAYGKRWCPEHCKLAFQPVGRR